MLWSPTKKRRYTIRWYYKFLKKHSTRVFPWKNIWKTEAPLKASFFVWTASLGKIFILDNLRKCRLIVLDWCYTCKKSGESENHLLLHCAVAMSLWNDMSRASFGDTTKGCWIFGQLASPPESLSNWSCMDDDINLSMVVHMDREEWSQLWGLWMDIGWA